MSPVPQPGQAPVLALVGATGRFAAALMQALALRADVWGEIRLLSPTLTTATLSVRGAEQRIETLRVDSFDGVDVVLLNLPAAESRVWAERAVAAGAVVVDASAAHRLDDEVPLVVPGINGRAAAERPKGVIALPGPLTWALIDAAYVLHHGWELQQLIVTGFIASASKSDAGIGRLRAELEAVATHPASGMQSGDIRALLSDLPGPSPFPAPLALNVIPWVGQSADEGWTTSELAIAAEVAKVLDLHDVPIIATLVQVPVVSSHSMAIHARCARPVNVDKVRRACVEAPSLVVLDDGEGEVPTPVDTVGIDPRFVGRIRQPAGLKHQVELFLSADTLRRGAAAMIDVAQIVAEVGPWGQDVGAHSTVR